VDFQQFEKLRNELNQLCEDLLLKKGNDYTDQQDRLYNFREVAKLLGVSPMLVWSIYATKHFIAVLNYAKNGTLESEKIEMRLADLRNYVDLAYGLIKSDNDSQTP